MKSNAAMKLKDEGQGKPGGPPPKKLDAPLQLPFDQTGFTTEDIVFEVGTGSQINLKNEKSGSGSMTIYVITSDGQYSTSGLLGSSISSVPVDNGDQELVTVDGTGTFLLSITSPPVTPPEDPAPGGAIIKIVVPT
jgi:hypothetical protein